MTSVLDFLNRRDSIVHSVHFGETKEGELKLSDEERSGHVMMVGGTGTGKTNAMSVSLVQDIEQGKGVGVICPMKELAERAVEFAWNAGRKDVIYFEPGDPTWVTPFDIRDFQGETSVSVERTIQALLSAWGMSDSNETPRLERLLRIFLTVAHDADVDVPYLELLVEPKTKLRQKFAQFVGDDMIRRQLVELDTYRLHDFLTVTESTRNKLTRFSGDTPVARCMGLGGNAIDFRQIMDEGKVFIASLPESNELSPQMQKLFGTLCVNGFYHAAMGRPTNSKPFFLYIDEAPMFATQALGDALDHCRQKRLYFTFAVQRPSQFKADDPKLYDTIKNGAQTRVVFRVSTREDALELVDDMVFGLADPQIKYELWGIAYRPVNTYLPSFSHSEGGGENWDQGLSEALGGSRMTGGNLLYNHNWSDIENKSETKKDDELLHSSAGTGLVAQNGRARGENWADTLTRMRTENERHGGSDNWNETVTWAPATIHVPEEELRQVVLYSLEDRRRMESDALMNLPVGMGFVKVREKGAVMVQLPLVRDLSNPADLVEFKQTLHRTHSIPRAKAEQIIRARRAEIATIPPEEPTFDDDYTFSPATSWLKKRSD